MIQSRSGVWWTDDDPSVRVPGTLSRTPDQWQLDLIGTLRVNHQWSDSLSLVPPVTIYGACSGRRYTLRVSYLVRTTGPNFIWDKEDQADNQFSQTWIGSSLLAGDALPEATIYTGATFELTGLSEWWPFSGIAQDTPVGESVGYGRLEPTVVNCGNGMTITLAAMGSERASRRVRALSEYVVVGVERDSGFTLEELMEQAVIPLQSLLAITLDRPVEYFNLRLQPRRETSAEHAGFDDYMPISFDPGVIDEDVERESIGLDPFFTAKDVQAEEFIANWVGIASRAVVPVAVASSRSRIGSLPIGVVEAVNAAESLHRELHPEPQPSDFAEKVGKALKTAGGLDSKERRKVKSAVKITEVSLESRLLQLTSELGDEFCLWFYQRQAKEWASVSAAVRNALSHGYRTTHRVEHDRGALNGILVVTLATIRLRLLTEAGLPKDYELQKILTKNHRYLALMRQSVADWRSLQASMGS
ncbi:hypothetical protein J5Y04_31580 [Kitasatospora sp. RG8]|uniref:ApeA N-terminal domain 1-containing protein n=1 Tax=Kitasatospora sp. RG8 TaxID=2820815 RepID=UPI001AE08BAC|nr:HEPN domain-containing protein [Kitasatospora sp. RG8]MBP0454049.1 hypothetical protein [Kitasatospora sp. RG8]